MEILNIWLIKAQEAKLLKIVRWASANNKRIKDLTEEEIATAIRSHY